MRAVGCRFLFIILFLFSFACSASSYANYTVFTDEFGNIYLKAPDKLIVLPQHKAIPVHIATANGLLRLSEVNGAWQVEVLTREEWDNLNLTAGSDIVEEIRYGDFDGSGNARLFLALRHSTTSQLLISNLTGSPTVDAFYFEPTELAGNAQDTPVFSTFATMASPSINALAAGEFRVDESGAATYNMPLSLPAGIAGVIPQLAFSYNSSGGDGYMGSGWSFAGGSAITRCPKNLSVDTVQGNVSFTAADRLCLDGQRLVRNGAANDKNVTDATYWTSTTQFHTELDNLSLIRQHGTATQGPKGFTVETKSGEIHYYGDISSVTGNDTMGKPLALDARSVGNVSENGADAFFDSHAGSNIARLWALKAIKDVKGNYIVFKYHEDQALGEHYLTEVHYTGRAGGAAPFARVVLNYVDNTKIAVGWQAQKRVAMTKLLDTVNVELDGAIYRQYRLNYFNTNVLEEKNYLLSIQECADTGTANCLPATNFEWNQPPALNTGYATRCENSPGLPQYCWQEPLIKNYMPFATTFQLKGTSVERNFHQLIDINGDGFVDLVYPRAGSWRVRLGGTTSNWTQDCFTPPGEPTQCNTQPAVSNFATEITLSTVGINKKEYVQTIDYNGDGQRDLLVANGATNNWVILSFVPSSTTVTQCEPFPDNHICYPVEVTSNYTSIDTGFKATGLEGGALVADYDGDGLEDIVFISNGMFQAYRNRGMSSTNIHLGFEHKTNLGVTADVAPQFGVLFASYTADLKSASAVDVNGDGRTDILLKVTDGYCAVGGFDSYECRLEGYEWISYTGWRLYTSTGLGYNETQILGDYANLRAVDLNGDGYTDIMFQIGTTWYYSLSNGNTFLTPRSTNLTSAANLIGYTYFLDINGDGRTDMLLPTSTSSWRVMLSRPTKTHEHIIFEQRGTRSFDSGATIQFADVNADGKLDLLTSTNDSGWKIFLSNRPYTKDHVIRKITNGFGVATLLEYQAISDKDVYFRQNTPNNVDSDYFSPRAGMYVVSKVSSEVNSGKYVSVNYKYGGLLLHKKGRGLLGFEVLRTTDNQTGVVTETIYKQLFPYTGMPFKTTQSKDGVLMSYAENTLANRTTAYGGILPYISSSTEYNYQYGSDNTQYPLAKTVSSFVYDNYGNLTSSTVTQSDIIDAAKKLVTSTSNVFNSSTVYQRYGRLTSATVTKTLDGNSSGALTRQSSFTYNADLMLDTETLSPNSASTKIATRHLYDAAGNISSKQVTAATTATGTSNVTRTSSTTYDTRFRYPASTTDAAGNTTTFTYNGASANSVTGRINYIDSVNANNQSSRDYFDIIGRPYRSYVKGAQTADNAINSYTYWELCSAVGCPSGITGAYLRVRAERDGAPTQYQYLDKYGREVGAAAVLLDGNLSVSRTQYNDLGRPWRVYEPGSDNPSSLYNQSNYDILGRISGASLANGGSTSITYQGLTTLNVDARGKQSKTTANYLGQTLSTEDHLGSKLTFSYDVYGNLRTAVASSGSLSSTRSTNTYDTYGRKTQMVDQDKGSWTYTYNGFGELLTQTDAKTQVTSFMYDSAGRLVRRYDPSGTTCWEFGTSAASYNKGLLYRVSSYSGSVDCSTTATPLYRETYTYNSRGFVSNKLVHTAGHSFSLSTTYDSFGRPDTFNYPSWSLNPSTDDVVVKYGYQNGHMKQLSNAKNTTEVYQQITAVTARGQVAQLSFRNGMQESRTYDAATGWLDTLTLSRNNLTQQFMDYDYDTVGNVTHRKQHFGLGSNAGFSEEFGYDDLHRVTSRTIGNYNNSSGYAALPAGFKLLETYTYDVWGNIKSKTGIGHYCYDTSKTNRLTAVWSGANCTGTQQYTLGYDNNGNVTTDGKHTFTYTAFDKPSRISKGSNYTDFAYGPDRQLYRRTDVRNSQTTDSFYIDGLYERVTLPSGVIEHKFYVGNTVITKRSNNTHDELYLHKDNQGSTISISNYVDNNNGVILQQFIYDPWGRQYSVSTNSLFSTFSNPGTSKGYTGHNMVNDFEVIHMGGRTYNPHLGRFMQADPFVQAPGNLQNYNRYSYVLNNPMSYTDPSGYIFKKINKALGKFAPVFGIALMFIPGMQAWAAQSLLHAAATGFLVGGVSTGSLRGAMVGALTGAAFYQVGASFNAKSGFWAEGGVAHIGAHGITGGISSSLSGGKFGHGFFSAGFTKFAMGNAGFDYSNQSSPAVAGRVLIAAMIGGTASVIAGGKFKNGATTAAMAQLLNQEASARRQQQSLEDYMKEKYGNLPISDEERAYAEKGDRKSFWASRLKNGDPVAPVAIAILEDKFFDGPFVRAGNWANSLTGLNGEALNALGVDLMRAHISAVDFDFNNKIGIPGLLSPTQVAAYHHDVFKGYGLQPRNFGGTFGLGIKGFGFATPPNLNRGIWCSGCDHVGEAIR